MDLFGWHAIFLLMLGFGVVIVVLVRLYLVETVVRDLSRIRPRALVASYATLLGSRYFLLCSIVMAGSVGAIYASATVLPFVLMDRVGLSPTHFGLGMLLQSGGFVTGSLVVRSVLHRYGALRLVPVGLLFITIGSLGLAIGLRLWEPTYPLVMVPAAIYTFGIAFVMPSMMTASLAPYPHMAGAASSMSGFFQMGGGLLGGMAAALMDDPVHALATVIPVMGLTAIVAFLAWRLVPEPPPQAL